MKELEELLKQYIYHPVCDEVVKTTKFVNTHYAGYHFTYSSLFNRKINVRIRVNKKNIQIWADSTQQGFPIDVESIPKIKLFLSKCSILTKDDYNIKDILE